MINQINDKELFKICRNRVTCKLMYYLLVCIFGKEIIYKDINGDIIIAKEFRNKIYFINSIKLEELIKHSNER